MSKALLPGVPETFSLFGEPLFPQLLNPEDYETKKSQYEQALMNWEENPEDADAIIWLGRRAAYLGRLREATGIFSMGMAMHAEDSRMLRHRGHRFLNLRLFDLGITDLEKAAELETGRPDTIEHDGKPNPRSIPLSSLQFNIWYHLGLGYYLVGDLEAANQAYQQCMQVSDIPDKVVATTHWQYMTLCMIGRDEDAKQVLRRVKKDMDIIENKDYHRLLLMYKGETTPEQLMESLRGGDPLRLATTGYGIGNWYMYNGDEWKASEVWREVLATRNWPSFGYIAAEADMKRLCLPLI